MTWLQFKKKAEELGVKDTDKVWYIDISFDDDFNLERDEHCGVALG